MKQDPKNKYEAFSKRHVIALKDRTWPDQIIDKAPYWCSVDLRDGNQSLPIPMTVEQKETLFLELVRIGFKEIEIGFPSASDTEFEFARRLVEKNLIPDDVTVQCLVQCREHLIRRTFEAVQGMKRAVIHFYNSTNPLQRRVTFGATKQQIKEIAVSGASLVKELEKEAGDTEIVYQYSPESFSDTEIDYSVEICNAVIDVVQPTPERKLILNLPATVEVATPNVHADQIEYFCRNVQSRDSVIISLHTHNDRGTGVAATELALMAGADRIEGTLFGNGERTGNLDIVTVALNMYSQGVDPKLNFSDLPKTRAIYESCTGMTVHERHPYAGDLVFTAFSGSHQDAIKKGMDVMSIKKELEKPGQPFFRAFNEKASGMQSDLTENAHEKLKSMLKGVFTPESLPVWEVPYLPIDPEDLGRSYEAIIRINSQSGKGGLAYILLSEFGYELPKNMHPEVGSFFTKLADDESDELSSEEIHESFKQEYVNREGPLSIKDYEQKTSEQHHSIDIEAKVDLSGKVQSIQGTGNGPISAFVDALANADLKKFSLAHYSQHSLGSGSGADAATYIAIKRDEDGAIFWGVSVDSNIEQAGIKALVSAYNRAV